MRSEIEYPGLIIAAICHEVFPVKFYNHIWAYTHARPTMKLRLRDYTNTITLSKPIEGMRPKPSVNVSRELHHCAYITRSELDMDPFY